MEENEQIVPQSIIPQPEGKYIVLIMDCINHRIESLGTFDKQDLAQKFMLLLVDNDERIKEPIYEKVEDNEYQISVYIKSWLSKREISFRYFVKEY